jgi:hypothetical protein
VQFSALINRSEFLAHELSVRTFVFLSPADRVLYDPNQPLFGEDVFRVFDSVREDIEEAGKCLALQRGTLLAVLINYFRTELACNNLCCLLQLPWGVIADNMKPLIDKMQKGSDEQIKWYRVQNDLVVVNRAWRVPTSHPKESYTVEQARDVFNATNAFMKELAALV